MSNIRELTFDELAHVSGGGNAGDHDNNRSNSGGSSRNGGGAAPVTTANNAGMGALLATIGALAAGATPIGLGVAAVVGGLGAALPSVSSSNNDRGGGWTDTDPGKPYGQCRW